MSDWAGIKKAINSDISEPLNVKIDRLPVTGQLNNDTDIPLNCWFYIMDYKTYGENSGVAKNEKAMRTMYMTWYAINDNGLRAKAVVYADSIGQVGWLLNQQYGLDLPQIAQYRTLAELVNSSDQDILDQIYESTGKLAWLREDEVVNEFYTTNEDEFSKSYEKAYTVYHMGSPWWDKFNNQGWLKKLYDNLTAQPEHTIETDDVNIPSLMARCGYTEGGASDTKSNNVSVQTSKYGTILKCEVNGTLSANNDQNRPLGNGNVRSKLLILNKVVCDVGATSISANEKPVSVSVTRSIYVFYPDQNEDLGTVNTTLYAHSPDSASWIDLTFSGTFSVTGIIKEA